MQLAVQRLAIQAERSRGGGFVARHAAERAEDVVTFDICERSARVGAGVGVPLLAQPIREIVGADHDRASIPRRYASAPSGWCSSTGRAPLAVGGDCGHRAEARLHDRDAAAVGAPGRARYRPARRADDDERERLKRLERENRRAEARQRDPAEGVGVFRPGGARPPTEVMVAFIDEHRDDVRGRVDLRACCRSPRRRTSGGKAQQDDPTRRSARAHPR